MNVEITVLDAANQPIGPFSMDEIRQRLVTGEFHRTQLAHVDGLTEWTPLSGVLDYIAKKEQAASLQDSWRATTPMPRHASAPAPHSAPAPSPYSAPATFNAPPPGPFSAPATFAAPPTFNQPVTFNAPASGFGAGAPVRLSPPPVGFSASPVPAMSLPEAGRFVPAAGLGPPSPYAPFHLRVVASLIDSTIIYSILFVCMIPVFMCYIILFSHWSLIVWYGIIPEFPPFLNISYWGIDVLVICLYYGLMESSAAQATLGKQLVGLKVIDTHGEPLAFPQAVGRALGRFVGQFTCYMAYLLPLMTERSQALHDLLASTLVVCSEKPIK
jgi:uncharacterized RDD family membrane protein YckC